MSDVKLENINGCWSVVTPQQIYQFPSLELARNFYASLLENLRESDTGYLWSSR
jgi:hypothetical protein